MSKLLIAVVREPNVDPLLDRLIAAGQRVTVVTSFGGFLRADSKTLVLAVEDDELDRVIDVFSQTRGEEVEVPLVVTERLVDWRAATVHHAGATIFILPLERIVRT
jgi:uncharacterized protein YaaQ